MRLPMRYIVVLIISIPSLQLMGSGVDHWETILGSGSTCRYLVPGFMVDPGWINREYDDR